MSITEQFERRANRVFAEMAGYTLIEDLSPEEQKAALQGDLESKARYVRTPAGVRRFKRPIGAIILPRGIGSLDKIRIKDPVFKGFDLVEDRKGKLYDVGKDDSTGKYVALKHKTWDDQIEPQDSMDKALQALNEKLGGGTNSDKEEGEKPAPKSKKPAPKKAQDESASEDQKPQDSAPSKGNTSTAEIVDGKFVITTPDGKKHTRTATGKKPYTHALIRKNKEGSGSDRYFVNFATDEGKVHRESRIGAEDRAHNEIIELPTSGKDAPSTPEPKKTNQAERDVEARDKTKPSMTPEKFVEDLPHSDRQSYNALSDKGKKAYRDQIQRDIDKDVNSTNSRYSALEAGQSVDRDERARQNFAGNGLREYNRLTDKQKQTVFSDIDSRLMDPQDALHKQTTGKSPAGAQKQARERAMERNRLTPEEQGRYDRGRKEGSTHQEMMDAIISKRRNSDPNWSDQSRPEPKPASMGGQGSKERDAFIESHPKLKDVNDYHKPKLRDLSEKNFQAYVDAVDGGKSPDSVGAIMSRIDAGASWNPTTEKWSGQNGGGKKRSASVGDTSASDAADAATRDRVQKMKDEDRSKGRTNPYTSSLKPHQKDEVDALTSGDYASYMNARDDGHGHMAAMHRVKNQPRTGYKGALMDTDLATRQAKKNLSRSQSPAEQMRELENREKSLDDASDELGRHRLALPSKLDQMTTEQKARDKEILAKYREIDDARSAINRKRASVMRKQEKAGSSTPKTPEKSNDQYAREALPKILEKHRSDAKEALDEVKRVKEAGYTQKKPIGERIADLTKTRQKVGDTIRRIDLTGKSNDIGSLKSERGNLQIEFDDLGKRIEGLKERQASGNKPVGQQHTDPKAVGTTTRASDARAKANADRETMRQHEAANYERAPFRKASDNFQTQVRHLTEKDESESLRKKRLKAMEESIKEREMRLATPRYSGDLFERDRKSYQASIDRDKKTLAEMRAKETTRSTDAPSSSTAPTKARLDPKEMPAPKIATGPVKKGKTRYVGEVNGHPIAVDSGRKAGVSHVVVVHQDNDAFNARTGGKSQETGVSAYVLSEHSSPVAAKRAAEATRNFPIGPETRAYVVEMKPQEADAPSSDAPSKPRAESAPEALAAADKHLRASVKREISGKKMTKRQREALEADLADIRLYRERVGAGSPHEVRLENMESNLAGHLERNSGAPRTADKAPAGRSEETNAKIARLREQMRNAHPFTRDSRFTPMERMAVTDAGLTDEQNTIYLNARQDGVSHSVALKRARGNAKFRSSQTNELDASEKREMDRLDNAINSVDKFSKLAQTSTNPRELNSALSEIDGADAELAKHPELSNLRDNLRRVKGEVGDRLRVAEGAEKERNRYKGNPDLAEAEDLFARIPSGVTTPQGYRTERAVDMADVDDMEDVPTVPELNRAIRALEKDGEGEHEDALWVLRSVRGHIKERTDRERAEFESANTSLFGDDLSIPSSAPKRVESPAIARVQAPAAPASAEGRRLDMRAVSASVTKASATRRKHSRATSIQERQEALRNSQADLAELDAHSATLHEAVVSPRLSDDQRKRVQDQIRSVDTARRSLEDLRDEYQTELSTNRGEGTRSVSADREMDQAKEHMRKVRETEDYRQALSEMRRLRALERRLETFANGEDGRTSHVQIAEAQGILQQIAMIREESNSRFAAEIARAQAARA